MTTAEFVILLIFTAIITLGILLIVKIVNWLKRLDKRFDLSCNKDYSDKMDHTYNFNIHNDDKEK